MPLLSLTSKAAQPDRRRWPASLVMSHQSYRRPARLICHHSGRYLTVEENNPVKLWLWLEQHDFPGFPDLDQRFQVSAHSGDHQHLNWSVPAIQGVAMIIAGTALLIGAGMLFTRLDQVASVLEEAAAKVASGAGALVALFLIGYGCYLIVALIAVILVNIQRRQVVGVAAPAPIERVRPTAGTASATVAPMSQPAVVPTAPRSSPAAWATSTVAVAISSQLPTATPQPNTVPAIGGLTVQLAPLRITASSSAPNSKDTQGNITTFVPQNVGDGQVDTAWRVEGDGVNQWIELTFVGPVVLREVRVVPGYAKIDPRSGVNRFYENYRVRRVRLEFDNGSRREATLEDRPEAQPIPIDNISSQSLRIVILESLPPPSDGRPYTPISERLLYSG
ncbi:MAG: hypothetical protein HGA65_14745 [Oscillochloris sp.]|nr:hypothetical protein [Oscillochloris sp.]